jgi:pyrroloquinoline quinone biosynthesis protein E
VSGPELRPYTLVAELTHACPLACPYCSNPLALERDALSKDDWARVFREAAALGVLAIHLTGGEPLLRDDLEAVVRAARDVGAYTTLVTAGVPCTESRFAALVDAGLDHVQLSVQSVNEAHADAIAGARAHRRKRAFAARVTAAGLPLTLNVVLHRHNADEVDALVALALELGARRLELANVQIVGWAERARDALLPTAAQIERAAAAARSAADRLRGTLEILFAKPDVHTRFPRACMDGWARRYVVVSPSGTVLPCHAASAIPGLAFANVQRASVAEAWDAPGMRAFRGEGWMKEPCASCPSRTVDFGGCRCRALAIIGDAAATDPVCERSPKHALVAAIRAKAERADASTLPSLTLLRRGRAPT